jgi:hypothetical protein
VTPGVNTLIIGLSCVLQPETGISASSIYPQFSGVGAALERYVGQLGIQMRTSQKINPSVEGFLV